MNEVITRFAPSPTGLLHIGHAWSAILSHDRAKEIGGRFLLRIEDIDGTRSRPDFVEAILRDLAWLGLEWDGPVLFQAERLGLYARAIDRLKALGLLYPCFCTRAEIAASLSAPHGDARPLYPGTCRHLAPDLRDRRLAGEQHAWRLDMARALDLLSPAAEEMPEQLRHDGKLIWHDDIVGDVVATPEMHGDVILARKDAPASYHLAVTVDDAAQGVTHVVRGRDLFAATHVHRLLQALLGLPTPVYRHHALLADETGERLAKRNKAPTLQAMREAGIDGRALADDLRAGHLPIGFRLSEV
ncbi:tRNA glutamyl-Q(34) synthetase GluQRS [Sphingomonas sp. QA11]|uniref:tRNA glutamyl-Q(34) synthetase GluQRS n=1 Tax=Sphingomonas sp. QA11 TaxID=2950605 RepID=UPI00234AAC3A|nr:tRNA glutamyl-Q(34) synthetase GluQRS [Sphingomonas sp. QA11]WCM26250.1 tRNA glutamyl-Q(34) synthetase GluQRS [Sphingomonas sp. QA11]